MVANFDQSQPFASNPEIQSAIDWLLSQNLPPLPVAPQQNPKEYHKVAKANLAKQVGEHCPLDIELKPIPLFTGKNPSFLDRHGVPHLINHRQYQSKRPSASDLRKWFANPLNGIGTLGGHGGVIWLDFDIKKFESEVECSRAVEKWCEAHRELKDTFREQTHSGGWRFGVRVKQEPGFTNFTLSPGGKHLGEALGVGRFTVLSPTIGPSGNQYKSIKRTPPVQVESLESIGIYPSGKSKLSEATQQPQSTLLPIPGSIPLDTLLSEKARLILGGNNLTGDRSKSLTILIREAYGWENWARDNDVSVLDNTLSLAHAAGGLLGIESERVERILKTIDPASCHPAAAHRVDDLSCWLKIRRLDKATYEAKCPQFIKDTIAQQSYRKHDSQVSLDLDITQKRNSSASDGFDSNPIDESYSSQSIQHPDWVNPESPLAGTVESLTFNTMFEAGQGKTITIDDCFYEDSGQGFWTKRSDNAVLKAVALKLQKCFTLKKSKERIAKNFSFGTEAKLKSTFQFCRKALVISELPANRHLRCFANCTVDLRTGKPLPHDRNHFLTTAIAADYLPSQPCPDVFLDFIKSAYGLEQLELVRAYTSMLLDPTAPYGAFIHLMGPSGSGKGTLLRLWGEMFSLENFRSGDFKSLSTAEGRHQFLTGVALYTVPDCGGFVQGLKPFYELVDNGPMTGRALFSSHGYQKKWDARFVIASVDHLQVENSGDGWDRRCRSLITKAREGVEDPELGNKLAAVRGQIISWALAMPRSERDRIILSPSTSEQIVQHKLDAAIVGDPIRSFLDLCFRPSPNATPIQTHELHSWFRAFAEAHGYQGWGMSKFASHLKTVIPTHYSPRRRTTAKDGERGMVPAQWINFIPVPGAFVDISKMGDDSDEQGQRQNLVPNEPVWKCVKSACIEGGLTAFQDFKVGSATAPVGSVTFATGGIVTDPKEISTQQCFQDFGSVGSVGSVRVGGKPRKEFLSQENGAENSTSENSTSVEYFPVAVPLADPTDPTDPNPETIENTWFNLDQPPEPVTDPSSKVADPTAPIAPDQCQQSPLTGSSPSAAKPAQGGVSPAAMREAHALTGIAPEPPSGTLEIGDYVADASGKVRQIAKLAVGGWLTKDEVHISPTDLKAGLYSRVNPPFPAVPDPDPEESAAILVGFADEVDAEMVSAIVQNWSEQHKGKVWRLLSPDLRKKYKGLMHTANKEQNQL